MIDEGNFDFENAIPNRWNVESTSSPIYNQDWKLFDFFNDMACDLIPMAIMHTAGVVFHFFDEMGETVEKGDEIVVTANKIKIHDDTDPFAEGEIYLSMTVDHDTKSSGKISAESGQTKLLYNKDLVFSFIDV